jgi:hypothetical protein
VFWAQGCIVYKYIKKCKSLNLRSKAAAALFT